VVVRGNAGLLSVAHNSCRLPVALLVALVLTGCSGLSAGGPSNQSQSPVQHASLSIGGQNRTYRLFRPQALSSKQPAPLVVALTGCPSTADQMAAISRVDDQATAGGFAVVYPDPVNKCWNAGFCCGAADDVGFISQLVDRLSTEIRVDRSKVFAAGFSAGAAMAYRLACEKSDRFTAIASAAGQIAIPACQPRRPVSVLEMHGTNDAFTSYAKGADAVQQWVALDGCTSDPAQSGSGITSTSIWSNCRGGTVVRFDTIQGGHHSWFGSTFDPVPGEPNSSAVSWDFFSHLGPRG
jgi:polyhydroxybutyrate depolymerase